jgi:hypothetical protein
MQTFLPYRDYARSAQVLDYRRLGKQRVECKQIMLALENPTYGWQNHPAVKMWRGHEGALAMYGEAICAEWRKRGYKDTLLPFFTARSGLAFVSTPLWLVTNEAFHRSHQSNLIRKDPAFYAPKFPGVPDNLPYVWPK